MAVAFCATFIGVFMGTLLGIVSGYFGGWSDIVVQRSMEVLASFPGIMLALIVVAALGRPKESGSNIVMLSWQLRQACSTIGFPGPSGSGGCAIARSTQVSASRIAMWWQRRIGGLTGRQAASLARQAPRCQSSCDAPGQSRAARLASALWSTRQLRSLTRCREALSGSPVAGLKGPRYGAQRWRM